MDLSTTQLTERSEKQSLPRIPVGQTIDQPTTAAQDLARHTHECVDKRLELHP
jgi:hypothetical protein